MSTNFCWNAEAIIQNIISNDSSFDWNLLATNQNITEFDWNLLKNTKFDWNLLETNQNISNDTNFDYTTTAEHYLPENSITNENTNDSNYFEDDLVSDIASDIDSSEEKYYNNSDDECLFISYKFKSSTNDFWYDNLKKKKPESGDYIKIKFYIEEETHDGYCSDAEFKGEYKTSTSVRYLSIDYEAEFLKYEKRKMKFCEKNYDHCCCDADIYYTIKKYTIVDTNRQYQKRILDRSLTQENRLNKDILSIVKKY